MKKENNDLHFSVARRLDSGPFPCGKGTCYKLFAHRWQSDDLFGRACLRQVMRGRLKIEKEKK